jgi:hypothetical protein
LRCSFFASTGASQKTTITSYIHTRQFAQAVEQKKARQELPNSCRYNSACHPISWIFPQQQYRLEGKVRLCARYRRFIAKWQEGPVATGDHTL